MKDDGLGEEMAQAIQEDQEDPKSSTDNSDETAQDEPQDNPNPENEDGQSDLRDELPDKFFDSNGELLPEDEIAQIAHNQESKLTELAQENSELSEKLNRLEGKLEAIQGDGEEPEESDDSESLSIDELKQQAVENVKSKVGSEDFLDADPNEYTEAIMEELTGLMENRVQQTEQKINQKEQQAVQSKVEKARSKLVQKHPEAEDYLDTMAEIARVDSSVKDSVLEAETTEQAVSELEGVLQKAKVIEGDEQTLNGTTDDHDESEKSQSTNNKNGTSSSTVTNGTSSGSARNTNTEQEELESIANSLEKGMEQDPI